MANGDIDNTEVQDFITLNQVGISISSENAGKVDTICSYINADTNLILKNLNIILPVADSDSVQWLMLTKLFGATSLTMELLAGQDTEEENTRAQRFWDRYKERLMELMNSGGNVLEAEFEEDPRPNTLPTATGSASLRSKMRHMRFPQRAAADHYIDQREVGKIRGPIKDVVKGL